VRSEDAERRGRSGARRLDPRDDGAIADHEPLARLRGPLVALVHLGEAGLRQPSRRLLHRVERRRRRLHEGSEIVEVGGGGLQRVAHRSIQTPATGTAIRRTGIR